MRRKAKTISTRVSPRKSALSSTPAARRSFPAWIDAESPAVAFPAAVTSRVRDGLVLRPVAKRKAPAAKTPDADGAK